MAELATWIWPNVESRKDALFAIDEAFWVSLAVAGFTMASGLADAGRRGVSVRALGVFASGALLVGLAFGIRQKFRIAALAAFLLYTISHAYLWMISGLGSLLITGLVALALFHGVRGTFAYAKLASLPPGNPTVEQSFRAVPSNRGVEQEPKQE